MEKEVIVKWKIRETETARILKLLPALAEETKKEKGNNSYSIFQSETDPNEFILHEQICQSRSIGIAQELRTLSTNRSQGNYPKSRNPRSDTR